MSEPGPIVPTVLNSQLSAELQSEVDFFLKWGYLVIDNALTVQQNKTVMVMSNLRKN